MKKPLINVDDLRFILRNAALMLRVKRGFISSGALAEVSEGSGGGVFERKTRRRSGDGWLLYAAFLRYQGERDRKRQQKAYIVSEIVNEFMIATFRQTLVVFSDERGAEATARAFDAFARNRTLNQVLVDRCAEQARQKNRRVGKKEQKEEKRGGSP